MKKTESFLILLFLIFVAVTSPFAGAAISQWLTGAEVDIGLKHVAVLMIRNLPAQLGTVAYLAAGVLAVSFAGSRGKSGGVKSIDTIKVTDKIRIPVPAGDGQYGSARFLTDKEIAEKYEIIDLKNVAEVKQVVSILDYRKNLKTGNKERLTLMANDGHVLIVGGTRSGKTRRVLLENIVLSILAGNCNIVMDVKGELFAYTSGFAKAHGYEPIVIDFTHPLQSARYNFMQAVNIAVDKEDYTAAEDAAWDLVSLLVKESRGLDPLWYNGECAAIAASIMCVAVEAPKSQRTLTQVYWFLGSMTEPDEKGKIPLTAYLNSLSFDHPARKIFMQAKVSPERTRGSFFSSALGTLRLLSNDYIADMTSGDSFLLSELDDKKRIIYIVIPDEKKTYHPLASLIMSQLTIALSESSRKNGGRCKHSWIFRWDEFGNSPKVANMGSCVSMMAGRGILYNLVIQDYSQLEQYGDEAKTIRGNMACTIFLRSTNPDTLKAISKELDTYTVMSTSSSSSRKAADMGDGGQVSSSSNLMGRDLLKPHEVGLLETPYALCLPGGYSFVSILPDISEYSFHAALGMGSREQNQRLLQNAFKELPSRALRKSQIWNPFNETEQKKKTRKVDFTKSREE